MDSLSLRQEKVATGPQRFPASSFYQWGPSGRCKCRLNSVKNPTQVNPIHVLSSFSHHNKCDFFFVHCAGNRRSRAKGLGLSMPQSPLITWQVYSQWCLIGGRICCSLRLKWRKECFLAKKKKKKWTFHSTPHVKDQSSKKGRTVSYLLDGFSLWVIIPALVTNLGVGTGEGHLLAP